MTMQLTSDDSGNGDSDNGNLPQMDGSWTGGKGYDPIKELMRAVILRTIDDFNSVGEQRLEAIDYMESDEEEYLFSFRAICRHLNIDPDKTKQYIMFPKKKISTRRRTA